MIAHEHIQLLRLKEILLILMVATMISLLIVVGNVFLSPTLSFIVSLIFLVLGMNLCVYLLKKTGIATIFYILTALLTFWLNNIGVVGGNKILAFLVAGLLFEISFLLLKVKIQNVPADMIIGTSISMAGMVTIAAFILSQNLARSFPLELLNLILLAFTIGIITSTITFLLWHQVEHTKTITRWEAYLASLGR